MSKSQSFNRHSETMDDRSLDLQERDEFAQRLLQRDKAKHQSIVTSHIEDEPTTHTAAEEASIPIDKLREESRRAYLKKRTEKELTLLEQEIQEEEEMFHDDIAAGKLTKYELKNIELKKQILQLARKDIHDPSDSTSQEAFYHLPDDYLSGEDDDDDNEYGTNHTKRKKHLTKEQQNQAILKSRYKEGGKNAFTEQQIWEETQTRKAPSSHVGMKKHKSYHPNKNDSTIITATTTSSTTSHHEKEYDLLLEDNNNIDFILHDSQQGYDHRSKKHHPLQGLVGPEYDPDKNAGEVEGDHHHHHHEPNVFMSKREQLKAMRKQLPVYPYREEFLAAVKLHQVLILVGEVRVFFFFFC